MDEVPVSTYRRIVQILSDIRVIAWAIAVLLFVISGIFWLPFSLITFLAGVVLTLGLLSTVVYLTFTNERPIESLGSLIADNLEPPPFRDSPVRVATPTPIAKRANEVAQLRVIPEIDLKPYRSTTGRVIRAGVFLAYDSLDPSATDHRLFFASKLRLRFDNQDTGLAAIRNVTAYLRREGKPGEIRETQIGVQIRDAATRGKIDLNLFQILPVRITPYYELDCDGEIEKDWARILDDNCFLRVKVEATRQPPYCIDLNVDWETARRTGSVAEISPRRSGLCDA